MKKNNQFRDISPYWTDAPDGTLWNDRRDGKWKSIEDCQKGENVWYADYVVCRSYKAARRHLRKHEEIPIGTRFFLDSRFVGYDRILTKKKNRRKHK